MRKLTQKELDEVIRLHGLWLAVDNAGVRADLSNTDLSSLDMSRADMTRAVMADAVMTRTDMTMANMTRADMSGADMSGANLSWAVMSWAVMSWADMTCAKFYGATGNKKEIKSLQLDTYDITYTHDRLQIGCENHSLDEWRAFTDDQILEMDGERALKFWKKYKDFIFSTIELSPAVNPKGDE